MIYLRILWLVVAAHVAYPEIPIDRLLPASARAVDAEIATGVPASVLIAIAHHESDVEPGATSWVIGGKRHDATTPATAPSGAVVCGYEQAMATRDECAIAVEIDGAMRMGAQEIAAWLEAAHGDLGRALAGHACGNAGFRGEPCPFALLFIRDARRLGWRG